MTAAPSHWRVQAYEEVASTQDLAITAARAGQAGHLAILASRQVAGRGSRGRSWSAPAGNLNLSVLLRPDDARLDPGHWSMLAGLALYDALRPDTDALTLKWPNDLLIGTAKIGGILIDSSVAASGFLEWVVIGFGANLAEAPAVDGRDTACLPPPAPGMSRPAASDIASAVLAAFDRRSGAELREAWLARAHPPGTLLDIVTPQGRMRGRFAGITARGELLLEGHPTPVSSAEVFVQHQPPETSLSPCC